MKNTVDISKALSNTWLFCTLDEADTAKLNNCCTLKSFKKGDTVFSGDTREKCIGVLADGEATVKKGEVIINRLSSGDIFGAVTLYNSSDSFVNNIIAITSCTVVFISKQGVEKLIDSSPEFSKRYIEYLSERIYFLNSKIKAYTIPDAEDKLYNYLCSISTDGRAELNIKMTDLAKLLNLSRASLYRVFDELVSSGKIVKNGKNIIII